MTVRLGAAGPRRIGAAAAVAAVVAVVTVVVLTTRSPASPNRGRGDSATTSGAVRVQRRDLVKTDTEAGTLGHPGGRMVYNRLTGTITWLPHVGEVIRPGHALFDVDDRPVILMRGTTPAYRTLSAADGAGADIEQLNRDLVALHFNSAAIVIDDEWQAATTYGVELLQRSLGQTGTGTLTLGRVVFLPGPQLVSSLDATVGSAAAAASARASAPPPQFVELRGTSPATPGPTPPRPTTPKPTTTQGTSTTSTSAATAPSTHPPPQQDDPSTRPPSRQHGRSGSGANALSALTARLEAQRARLRAQAAQLSKLAAQLRAERNQRSPGAPATPGESPPTSAGATPVLRMTSTRLVVKVDLSASSQGEAKVGERVTVEMPAGNTVGARITAVSAVAQTVRSGNGDGPGGSSPTVPVTATLSGRPSGTRLDQAPVSVNFSQAVARHVLSVPVTALLATSGGHYAVQSASAPRRLIAVRTGLFAAGYVQISGRGIRPGLRVTDSQG